MRGTLTAIGIFGIVGWFIVMTGLRWLSEYHHGYGKKPTTTKPSSAVTPASYPRPGRRFERDQEPRGM